jgi:hypothetical protein
MTPGAPAAEDLFDQLAAMRVIPVARARPAIAGLVMTGLTIRPGTGTRYYVVSLGVVMPPPGSRQGPYPQFRSFTAWEGGGEYNGLDFTERGFGVRGPDSIGQPPPLIVSSRTSTRASTTCLPAVYQPGSSSASDRIPVDYRRMDQETELLLQFLDQQRNRMPGVLDGLPGGQVRVHRALESARRRWSCSGCHLSPDRLVVVARRLRSD